MISGEARDGAVRIGPVVLPIAGVPGAVTIGLRPEHLRFTGSGLSGRIAQIEPMARDPLCRRHRCGIFADPRTRLLATHAVGEPVSIGFSPEDLLVFDAASERLIAAARVGLPA